MVAAAPKAEEPIQHPVQRMDPQSDDEDCDRAGGQGDIQPVGHDYVEEVSRKNKNKISDSLSVYQRVVCWLICAVEKKKRLTYFNEQFSFVHLS